MTREIRRTRQRSFGIPQIIEIEGNVRLALNTEIDFLQQNIKSTLYYVINESKVKSN
jgi:hypothetical protein